ncbi:hypothetical protein HHK36_007785 [Tetracentron sinense]|uniref:Uncharacterized protein n=1 Tax=Tetracentron sinense TaxID=13715 RepID=A0A835DIQ0_TETSI|nr:hypothetical protein HHK36_007785 [Tetracentron sinense]
MESPLILDRSLINFRNSFTSFLTPGKFKANSSSLQTNRRGQLYIRLWKRTRTRTQTQSWISYGSTANPILDLRFEWLRCFDFSWRLASRIISIYLFCLNLVADAHADPALSFRYDCEDVSNYYARVEHMKGLAKQVWDALKILDAADVDHPEASSEVHKHMVSLNSFLTCRVEIYSLRVVSKLLAGKPEGWNREHLWPRSYGLIRGPSSTDLHNIRPEDVNVNSSRRNKYYGECPFNSTDCLKPANKEAASDTETDKERWAPPFQVRGDIARALMYMAVCYGFHQPSGSPNLHLSDSPSADNGEMGLLSILLKWNEVDPPSRVEKLRNDRICRLYQHNRNPFVDHPEYANLIFNQANLKHQSMYTPSLKAWINEFHYNNRGRDQNEQKLFRSTTMTEMTADATDLNCVNDSGTGLNNKFVEIVVGSSTNADELELVLYNGANGKSYASLPLIDKGAFRVTNGGSGFLIYTASLPIQNGQGDGIALLGRNDDGVQMIQFVSYQGVVKAMDGPAMGKESVDIGFRETEESSENDSLGLTGSKIGEFKWKRFLNGASPGKPNMGQILSNW